VSLTVRPITGSGERQQVAVGDGEPSSAVRVQAAALASAFPGYIVNVITSRGEKPRYEVVYEYGRCPDEPPLYPSSAAAHDVLRSLRIIAGCLIVGILGLFAIRWGITEYYITTHCTTVLGTRVCQ
jgi:hypothetical protein